MEVPRFGDDCEELAGAPAAAAVPVSAVFGIFAFFLEGAIDFRVGFSCSRESKAREERKERRFGFDVILI